jgi:dihydroorotase
MRLVAAMSTNPARLLGLEVGTLKPGAPADLVVVDLDRPWVVREEDLSSRSKNTAFEGALLTGKVLRTMVGGEEVYRGD